MANLQWFQIGFILNLGGGRSEVGESLGLIGVIVRCAVGSGNGYL